MTADQAWEEARDDIFNVVADIDSQSARIQYAFLAGWKAGQEGTAALSAADELAALQKSIARIVRDAYQRSRGGTGCRGCPVWVPRRVSLEEFAGWLHTGDCWALGITIPMAQAALAAASPDHGGRRER